MDFDALASCAHEEVMDLPVCRQGDPSTLKLHAAIQRVVAWMAVHHIPMDPYDAPYVYRDYMADWISGNDVAALGRITRAANSRNVNLPIVFQPLLPVTNNDEVRPEEVKYVAANADELAEALGPLLEVMQAVDMAPGPVQGMSAWWVIFGLGAGAVLLGLAVSGIYAQRSIRG